MLTFEYILILLTAVFLSNLINRLIPLLSVPIVQIILGVIISLLLSKYNIALDTSLFFVLFIAPLIFNAGMLLDRKTFWLLKGPIINMAVVLVIVSIFSFGYFLHILIPVLPLALTFILVAALAPTDDVAIISVSHRVAIPHKLMNLLTGESIINDATGIVSFQLALVAAVSGSFSAGHAVWQLLLIGLGGLFVGLAFAAAKYIFTKWIRSLGMENVTLHILLEILTPFAVYLLAEALGVSGILAVFAIGVVHSLGRDRQNPENANINLVSKNVWSVLSFTLEGMVYLILGTQLPRVLQTLEGNVNHISIWELLFYVLIITVLFAASRFVWLYITTSRKSFSDSSQPVKKWKASLIFSLSGARGAVTMASILSIPVILSDGSAFPQRDLIILLASGVILFSLLITNFILPLVVEKPEDREKEENEACQGILNNVIATLEKSITKENQMAVNIVLRQYQSRINALQYKLNTSRVDNKKKQKLKTLTWEWEKQNTLLLMNNNEINPSIASSYMDVLERNIDMKFISYPFKKLIKVIRMRNKIRRLWLKNINWYSDFLKLKESNCIYVLQKLKEQQAEDDCYELRKLQSDYEALLIFAQNRIDNTPEEQVLKSAVEECLREVVALGFQIERDNIQIMFEDGHISRDKAKELRNNIMLLEME